MDYNPQPGDNLVCSCGNEIGELVGVENALWLNVGSIEVRNGHGRCSSCQKIWHYDARNIKLHLLIKHAIINQLNIHG